VASGWLRPELLHSAFFLLHFLPSPPKCPGPWPATPTFHENRLDECDLIFKVARATFNPENTLLQLFLESKPLDPGTLRALVELALAGKPASRMAVS
jgi:hypothetical protein